MNRILLGAIVSAMAALGFGQGADAQVEISGRVYHVAVCPRGNAPGTARCHAHIVTDRSGKPLSGKASQSGGAGPYGPSDLQSAYNLTSLSATKGAGVTIAIVDAFGYTNAESDLATYRSHFGLPPCHSGIAGGNCFTKVNENGVAGNYPHQNTGWAEESALDLDMVSAICPNCHIILVEANSQSFLDLATAVNSAASLKPLAISNSYGGSETQSQSFETDYNHPGIAITASSGDNGYKSAAEFPASSPHVTAVGGTSLFPSSNPRGWTESAWSGAGSGCSSLYAKPPWQSDTLCPMRTVSDVSAVADPSTGVSVFFSGHWYTFGGTSVSAPLTAGVYGLNGGGAKGPADSGACAAYANTSSLFDVTSGASGHCGGTPICTAVVGYDGPTGLGTPNGDTAY